MVLGNDRDRNSGVQSQRCEISDVHDITDSGVHISGSDNTRVVQYKEDSGVLSSGNIGGVQYSGSDNTRVVQYNEDSGVYSSGNIGGIQYSGNSDVCGREVHDSDNVTLANTSEMIRSDNYENSGDEVFVNICKECGCNIGQNSSCLKCVVQLHEVINASKCYNFECCKIPVSSNVNIPFWKDNLKDYHDNVFVQYLEFGWPVNYRLSYDPTSCRKNHSTAEDYANVINDYISTEIQFGALAGPYNQPPFSTVLITSPLHSVPKKGQNNDTRRIVLDLSYPPKKSVNEGIPQTYDDLHLEYPSVDRLIDLLVQRKVQDGAWMLKRDLSRAYRQLRVDPYDYRLLGFKWEDKYYFDMSMPFGLRSAAQACQRVTSGLAHILQKKGINIINYVDDIAAVAISESEAIEFGEVIDNVITVSGLHLAEKKSVNATQKMTFLGIQFDSAKMTMEVTPERLEEIRQELQRWIGKRRATRKEIQSLAGKLQFIAKCCKHGRCFMSRILSVLKGLKRSSYRTYLNEDFRKDVQWWFNFLPHFHSVSIIKDTPWSNTDAVVATDACLKGGGGIYMNRYFKFTFPEEFLKNISGITQLEAVTVTVALKLWGHRLHGQKFIIHCDNEATVYVINSGRARDAFLQQCAREIAFLACKYEFEIRAQHIEGINNRLPDWLSRACLDTTFMKKFQAATNGRWIEEQVNINEILTFSCSW